MTNIRFISSIFYWLAADWLIDWLVHEWIDINRHDKNETQNILKFNGLLNDNRYALLVAWALYSYSFLACQLKIAKKQIYKIYQINEYVFYDTKKSSEINKTTWNPLIEPISCQIHFFPTFYQIDEHFSSHNCKLKKLHGMKSWRKNVSTNLHNRAKENEL